MANRSNNKRKDKLAKLEARGEAGPKQKRGRDTRGAVAQTGRKSNAAKQNHSGGPRARRGKVS